MEIKYVKGEFIETGIKVTIEGNFTAIWVGEFRNAKVTNITFDSGGDYLLLDLKKTEITCDFLIQRMDLDDAARLKDEFVKRVKIAIAHANQAILKYKLAQENKRIEDEKTQNELSNKLKKMNEQKF